MAITRPSSRNETIKEHRELCEMVEHLRKLLAEGRTSQAMIVERLQDLSAMLLEHFRHEETGGYFAESLRVAPHIADRVESLLSQHPQMMDLLASLIDNSIGQEPIRQRWQKVDTGYAHFVSLFLSHEAAETALLQDVHLNDLGYGD